MSNHFCHTIIKLREIQTYINSGRQMTLIEKYVEQRAKSSEHRHIHEGIERCNITLKKIEKVQK